LLGKIPSCGLHFNLQAAYIPVKKRSTEFSAGRCAVSPVFAAAILAPPTTLASHSRICLK